MTVEKVAHPFGVLLRARVLGEFLDCVYQGEVEGVVLDEIKVGLAVRRTAGVAVRRHVQRVGVEIGGIQDAGAVELQRAVVFGFDAWNVDC